MKYFDWNKEKNEQLKVEREVSFEEITAAIDDNGLLAIENHPNQEKYPNQKMFIVKVRGYVFLIPFVEDESKIFLKTIIPSRKATKKYINEGGEK